MSVRWHPLEADLLSGLEALGGAPGPRYVVGPAGREDAPSLARLVLEEARAYADLERAVAARRLEALEKEAGALADGVEHDRRGKGSPRSLPGQEDALERARAARRALEEHEAALSRVVSPQGPELVRAALAAFEVRPRRDLDTLRAAPGEGQVVELFADGYALSPDRARQLAARREFLGLPAGKDWL